MSIAADNVPDWRRTLRERLVPIDGAAGVIRGMTRGDYDLNPEALERIRAGFPMLCPAAVLVPLVGHPRGPTVLLTQRTAHLKRHAGQVAFPGGRCEALDTSPVET